MSDDLRVAQLVCSDGFAGVERYVANLSNDLADAGCDVVVLGGAPDRMRRELSGRQESWWPVASVGQAIFRLARLGHFDIVHTHMTAAEIAASAVRVVSGGHFVTTRHFADRRGTTISGRWAGVAIRRLAPIQVAVSDYVAARIDGTSVVLHPGVPSQVAPPNRPRKHVVLVAQRLEAEKHSDIALRTWERAGLARWGWEIHFAGGGAQEGALRKLARDLGVTDSVQFLGPRDDMAEMYQTASLFLASRPDEALGLAVLEAMAAGLPVVAAAGGGHLETVGACPGAALFPPDDVDGAAALLTSLGSDEERRQAYGQRLQSLQRERFDASSQSKRMVAMYESIVDPRP